jgi:hypothetical protein
MSVTQDHCVPCDPLRRVVCCLWPPLEHQKDNEK